MNRIGLLIGLLAWYVISALLALYRANPKKIELSNDLEKECSGLAMES